MFQLMSMFHLAEMDYRKDYWQVPRLLCEGIERSVPRRVCCCWI